MDEEYLRGLVKQYGLVKPDGYNAFAAGSKLYGTGRSNPTSGSIGPDGMQGYRQRDAQARVRKMQELKRMRSNIQGRFMSQPSLGGSAQGRRY